MQRRRQCHSVTTKLALGVPAVLLTLSLWAVNHGLNTTRELSISSPSTAISLVPKLVSAPAVDANGTASDGYMGKKKRWMQAMLAEMENAQRESNKTDEKQNGAIPENCLDPRGPLPIILMSLGRSGSGSTWQVIGSLTGMETPSFEYTGSNEKRSQDFFTELGPNEGGWWLMKYMCFMQRKFKNAGAGVVGFKWKPFYTMQMPASLNALKLVAKLRSPGIKIVRSRRNLLDVMISKEKHRQYKIPAHCEAGDEACVKMHLEAGKAIELPTENLLELLGMASKEEHDADKFLDELGVPHVHVSFEKLYYGDDADEWLKIFRFLGVGPTEGLTMRRVNEIMEHASTSHPSHKKTVRNFDQVRRLLSGTEFQELLHP